MSDDSQQHGTSDGSEVAQKDARQGNEADRKAAEASVAQHDQGTDHAASEVKAPGSDQATPRQPDAVKQDTGSVEKPVEAPKPAEPAPVSAPSQTAGVNNLLIVGLVIVLVSVAYAVAKNQGWLP